MSEEQQQGKKQMDAKGKEELPLESSPYVNYSDLEDYKQKGYGTQGHLEPVENSRTGGATEGPTLSGSDLSRAQAEAVENKNRHGPV
ncbi:uncharacterized protein LOC110116313 [Dendrobium catenatum]|uniref:Uncharacterized protein n=1 Tax=Dendrobium catenatum TaxID=906689 RepID=A0A2I0WVP8_9ASPA|nr:uncharacterized protein LOC110116313 [Dendrobium catenatum]PKU79732.1 hypothetical protein MA16_Dca010960 [Dendrobium catenatum]